MKHKLIVSVLLIVFIGFICSVQSGKTAVLIPAHQPTNSPTTWHTLPGPSGGSIADIVLSPAYPSPETLFAGLRGQGVYRSDDGAYSWQTTGSGDWIVRDLAISPDFATDETLFALAGVWPTGYTVRRTADGGQTWQASSSPTSFAAGRRLVISPDFTNDHLVYLVTGVANSTFVSTDSGDTFTQVGGWFTTHHVNELAFSPAFATDHTIFSLVANDGIYRSTDSGSSWLPVEISRAYTALAVSPNYAVDDTITAVATTGTIYTSPDDGATWNPGTGVTLGTGGETSIAYSPTFGIDQVIMAASSTDASPVRSLDSGVTWNAVGVYNPTQSYKDGMIGGDVYALALAPEQDWDGVQFAGTSSGVARSPYRGDSWLQMNEGLPLLSVRSFALAPGNPDILLAGTEFYETRYFDSGAVIPGDGNVQWSQDGGQTWRHVTGHLGRVNEVAFSPNFANDETAFAVAGMIGQHGLVEGGVYRSQDNSETWTAVFTPAFHAFQTLAVSPNFAVDETVWASASTYSSAIGLYQSTNAGDNWVNIASGLNINLLDVSPNYAVDHTLFAGMGDDGIQRSLDSGVTWVRVLDVPYPTALAISPAYGASRTVYAAARTDVSGVVSVYRSTDNGTTWQELNTGIPTEQDGANRKISTLTFAVDGSVLAGVQYGESGVTAYVYRSSDGGASWQMVDGPMTAAKLYELATVPNSSFDVFAATDLGVQSVTIHQGEAAEPGVWQSNGPRGGKANALAVSPDFASDGMVFTGEWYNNYQGGETGSRLVKSTDFGQTWRVSAAGTAETGNETAVHDYAYSNNFANDHTVFAATGGGLFQSTDGGAHWQRNDALYQPPGIIDGVDVAPDFATSGHIMATGWYGGLYVSQDSGDSWTVALPNSVSSMAYSPAFAADNTVFVVESTFDGSNSVLRVTKSTDLGVTWLPVYTAPVTSLAVSPNYAVDQTVFAGGAVFHLSTDGGATWLTHTVAADIGNIWSLAVSPNYAVDQTVFAGTSNGLYQSADGGTSWQLVPGYENTSILSLAISPQWPTHAVLLVGTNTGVFRLLTADVNVGVTREATQGLVTLSATVMALTADSDLLLAGTHNHGLYASADEGQTWSAYGFNDGSTFSGARALAFSPDYALDQTVFAGYGSKYTGYYRSTDSGATWENLLGIYTNASIAVSPDFAQDQTVFVTGEDSGELQRSADAGDTWQEILSWDRSRGANLIALPPDYPGNGRLFIGTWQGFWFSPDDGTTWQQAATGLVDGYSLVSLKVSPDFVADQTLIAVASWSDAAYHQYSGVFKSVDAGVNWALVNTGVPDEPLRDVAFSPNFASDQTAYLITEHDLYRSLTGGSSWTVVGAPPEMPTLQKVLVDSSDHVFVSSETGVWRYGTVAQDIIVNGRFESNAAWVLPQTAIPADYTTEVVYNGQRSMRIGLVNGTNVNGYSSARQTFTLPDEPLLAQLTFYVYPVTGEETAVTGPIANPENITAGDAQYGYLYDGTGSTNLETLYWDLSNDQAWQKHTVNLAAYGGQDLMLYFGVKNDGQSGLTGMYVDDVSLLVIDGSLYPYKTYLPVILKP